MKTFKQFKGWLLRSLLLKFVKTYSNRTYQGIDTLPIFYWNKIHQEDNIGYLMISPVTRINVPQPKGLRKLILSIIWRQIMDQYIAKFGFSEKYIDIIRKQKEIAEYRVRLIANDDNTVKAFIQIAEQELEMIQSEVGGGDFWAMKLGIERALKMNFPIDPMKVCVTEFYSYLEQVKRAKKQIQAAQE